MDENQQIIEAVRQNHLRHPGFGSSNNKCEVCGKETRILLMLDGKKACRECLDPLLKKMPKDKAK